MRYRRGLDRRSNNRGRSCHRSHYRGGCYNRGLYRGHSGGLVSSHRVRHDKIDTVTDRRIIFELDTFLLDNTVMLAHRGKEFGLFNRINAQVGLHVQVQIKHILRVARLFRYHINNIFCNSSFI